MYLQDQALLSFVTEPSGLLANTSVAMQVVENNLLYGDQECSAAAA
jgi:hypothetical protein